MQSNESEFVEADPFTRTLALASIVAVVFLIAFGPAAVKWLLVAPSSASLEAQMEHSRMVGRLVGTVSPALFLPFAWLFFRWGLAALRTRAWPPLGMRVPWRLRRRRGRYAIGMGAGCIGLGCLSLLQAALHAYAGWFIGGR